MTMSCLVIPVLMFLLAVLDKMLSMGATMTMVSMVTMEMMY